MKLSISNVISTCSLIISFIGLWISYFRGRSAVSYRWRETISHDLKGWTHFKTDEDSDGKFKEGYYAWISFINYSNNDIGYFDLSARVTNKNGDSVVEILNTTGMKMSMPYRKDFEVRRHVNESWKEYKLTVPESLVSGTIPAHSVRTFSLYIFDLPKHPQKIKFEIHIIKQGLRDFVFSWRPHRQPRGVKITHTYKIPDDVSGLKDIIRYSKKQKLEKLWQKLKRLSVKSFNHLLSFFEI